MSEHLPPHGDEPQLVGELSPAFATEARIVELEAENAALRAELEQLKLTSTTDELTGALNRRGIRERYEDPQHAGTSRALIRLDLDFFKVLNDNYGYGMGDLLLKTYVAFGSRKLRPDDAFGLNTANTIFSRIGGDEGLVLAPLKPHSVESSELTDDDRALAITERIVTEFKFLRGIVYYNELNPSVPLGIKAAYAVIPPRMPFEDALKKVDMTIDNPGCRAYANPLYEPTSIAVRDESYEFLQAMQGQPKATIIKRTDA
jgi:diguanylate cyclase (GGDEF)-like protein